MSTYEVPFDEPEIGELERLLLLRSFFAGEEEQGAAWEWLSRSIVERRFKKGELLRWNGIDRLHLLVRGGVALIREGNVLRRFGPGEMVGMVDALMGRTHRYDLLVEEETVALEVLYEDWIDFVEDHFELARRGILKRAAELLPRSSARAGRKLSSIAPPGRPLVSRSGQVDAERQDRISAAERLAVLRLCPPLQSATLQALARLVRYSETVELSGGEQYLALPDALYIVEAGRLSATARAGERAWTETIEAGAALGGLSLLQPGPYEVTATALDRTFLLRVSTERVLDVMEDDFSLTHSLLSYIVAEMEIGVANQEAVPLRLGGVPSTPPREQ